jgi:hypothetical protein
VIITKTRNYEMNHMFNVEIATKYDLNISVFMCHIKFWTLTNLANKRNIHDGLCWTYNTLDAFGRIFPYWSRRQLETIINNAIAHRLIKKGNYNKSKYDRTCWYALTIDSYEFFPELKDPELLKLLILPISRKCEIYFTEVGNVFHENVTPIPDKKPDKKTDKKQKPFVDSAALKPSPPPENRCGAAESTVRDFSFSLASTKPIHYKDDELFMSFYKNYPNKQKPVLAHKEFLKHRPSESFVKMVANDIAKRMQNNWHGRDKSKIPHPATYLRNCEWEGEIYAPQLKTVTKSTAETMYWQ